LLAELNVKTVVAMQMCETFQQLYQLDNVGMFALQLRKWCAWLQGSGLAEMQAVKSMVEAHWDVHYPLARK